MKHFILTIASIAIFLSTTITQAAPQKLPSRSQLIKLIKKVNRADLGVTGLESYKDCDKVSIDSIKILKVGRASSNYYKESGNYIDSNFMVKLKATGSCSFDHFHEFFSDIDGDGKNDYISGTLPIINEPLEVSISTDSYGDWEAGSLRFVGDNYKSKRIMQHIKRLFIRGKAAMGGNKYTSRVVINNIRPNQGAGIYNDGFAVSNEKRVHFYNSTIIKKFGTSYRAADWYDLKNYSANNGNVLALLKKLGISSQEGVYITSGGYGLGRYVAVHCTAFDSNKYFGVEEKIKAQPLCLAEVFDNKATKVLAVKRSVYGDKPKSGQKPRLKPQKRSSVASNLNANDAQQMVVDLNNLKKEFPQITKIFNSQPKAKRRQLAIRFAKEETSQGRRRVFLQIGKELNQKTSSNRTNASRHSHSGRYHVHPLPRQGVAHRHGNGAVGR